MLDNFPYLTKCAPVSGHKGTLKLIIEKLVKYFKEYKMTLPGQKVNQDFGDVEDFGEPRDSDEAA